MFNLREGIVFGALMIPSIQPNNDNIVYQHQLKILKYKGDAKMQFGIRSDFIRDDVIIGVREYGLSQYDGDYASFSTSDSWNGFLCGDIMSINYNPSKATIWIEIDGYCLYQRNNVKAGKHLIYQLFVSFIFNASGHVQLQLL